jgi:hypothetical protein
MSSSRETAHFNLIIVRSNSYIFPKVCVPFAGEFQEYEIMYHFYDGSLGHDSHSRDARR